MRDLLAAAGVKEPFAGRGIGSPCSTAPTWPGPSIASSPCGGSSRRAAGAVRGGLRPGHGLVVDAAASEDAYTPNASWSSRCWPSP